MKLMKMKISGIVLMLLVAWLPFSAAATNGDEVNKAYAPDGVPFRVAASPWDVDQVGNHRATVKVAKVRNRAVRVVLGWRRPDRRPETKRVVIIDGKTGREVRNIRVDTLTSETGDLLFEPQTVPGTYYVYYLPYRYRQDANDARYGEPWNDYLSPEYSADKGWLAQLPAEKSKLPLARVNSFEARSEFDFFTVMGTTATDLETRKLLDKHPENPILVQEDRLFPIRLPEKLPYRWVQKGMNANFEGEARPNEYYVWQVGVVAARQKADNVRLLFSDLRNAQTGAVISKDSITCFNQEGVNWDGTALTFRVNVPQGKVQALWCGLQIPANTPSGNYKGTVTYTADGVTPRKLDFSLRVAGQMLTDKGDADLWRMSRLRWLNSTIGLDNHPVAPFKAMAIDGRSIHATDKTLTVNGNGLPSSITINGKEIFQRPLRFAVVTDDGEKTFAADNVRIVQKADGLVVWEAGAQTGGITFDCNAKMEYDGYADYRINVKSDKAMKVKDIRLVADYTPYVSEYFMGAGFGGGYRPASFSWDWKGPYDSYWIGNALAGLHVEYRGGTYNGPLLNDYKPKAPQTWANDGNGVLTVSGERHTSAEVLTSTGATVLDERGKTFEFALLITPAKPVDTRKQFSQRYFQGLEKNFDERAEVGGANIINIHQGKELNPFINYPFIVRDSLRAYIGHEHQSGRKVKLYYTIRELSNYCAEIYALKSMNHEILLGGVGYGEPWLCEHLVDDYKPAWYTPVSGQREDASLAMTPFSRWINYYLEGYRWMLENYGIDGLYMDDVAFDREILKRMRHLMSRYRPGSLIDLHSNTGYSVGPANQYTGFFPYVDRLWFGESFKYNQMMPDEWFVTFSGIPFGQMSEMLQDGGNKYLGMVYGASLRDLQGGVSPVPVWKVWKDFGIGEAVMYGYWDEHCPVTTGNDLVKATAYVKPDKVLIAVGNFDAKNHDITLKIDFKALGFDAKNVSLTAPDVAEFQQHTTFSVGSPITVKAKQGWLIELKPQ